MLISLKIPYRTVADLDYAKTIGTREIKSLWSADVSVANKTISNKKSRDGQKLLECIDEAVATNNLSGLITMREYLASRFTSIVEPLSAESRAALHKFIIDKRTDSVYLLPLGELEDHLPDGRTSPESITLMFTDPNFYKTWSAEAPEKYEAFMETVRSLLKSLNIPLRDLEREAQSVAVVQSSEQADSH